MPIAFIVQRSPLVPWFGVMLAGGDGRSDPIWGTTIPIWGAHPDATLRLQGDDDLVTPIDEKGEQSAPHTGEAGRIDSVRPTPRSRGSETGRIVRYYRSTPSTSIRRAVDLHKRYDHNADDGAPHSHGDGQVRVGGQISVIVPERPRCIITKWSGRCSRSGNETSSPLGTTLGHHLVNAVPSLYGFSRARGRSRGSGLRSAQR